MAPYTVIPGGVKGRFPVESGEIRWVPGRARGVPGGSRGVPRACPGGPREFPGVPIENPGIPGGGGDGCPGVPGGFPGVFRGGPEGYPIGLRVVPVMGPEGSPPDPGSDFPKRPTKSKLGVLRLECKRKNDQKGSVVDVANLAEVGNNWLIFGGFD